MTEEKNEEVQDTNGDSLNDLEKKIVKQLEYYFGDFNLGRDKFLNEKISEDNGWVPLSVLLTFKRLASLSTDEDLILNAITKSNSQLIEVNKEEKKIRRNENNPLPEYTDNRKKELILRTAYIKGFPNTKTLDDILSFFQDKIEPESCQMRHFNDKARKVQVFKGSVFVTFKTIEDCKKFIESGPYKYENAGPDLIVKWQEAYFEEKRKEKEEMKNNLLKNKNKNENDGKDDFKLAECCVVHFTGCPNTLTVLEIKKKLEELELSVAFVEYTKGEEQGYARLNGKDSSEKLFNKLKESKLEVNGAELTFRLLEGEELDKILKKMTSELKDKKHMQSRKRKRNNWQGRNQDKKKRQKKNKNQDDGDDDDEGEADDE